jgi:TetR/AcrR family transcriptional repressor of lmrAB and yxaGH operons
MRHMPKDTRQRMVATTATLLQRQGYHATGLNQILTESAAPKGSLYFHFPGGKEQLVEAAIAAAGDSLDRFLGAHEAGSTLESLDAYLADVAGALEETAYLAGCPIATVALEVAPTSAALGAACSAAFDRLIERLADWLERDGFSAGPARQTAQLLYSAIEGALLLAKARRSVEPLQVLRAQLPALVGALHDPVHHGDETAVG